MTLSDLIKEKDYDKIVFRMIYHIKTSSEKVLKKEIFYGTGYSKKGVFYALDDDNYDEELSKEPVSYREWETPDKDIKAGLTIVFDFSNNSESGED